MNLNRQQLMELLATLAATSCEEIDCEEFLARVGPLLERMRDAGDRPRELQVVSQHLEVCPPCREEFEALVELHFPSS